MLVSVHVVNILDLVVLGITSAVALLSLVGAFYVVPWSHRSRQGRLVKEFNHLWITRCALQLLGACYALSLDLRLQVRALPHEWHRVPHHS